ncbi:MAG TPA: SDR family NAD(P)-dependent oxidoreductase, partial [Acidimicrobiia bacterium]
MDLGLAGRKALLTASSRGLGLGCATALAREGVDVTINGLDPGNLEAAATELREFGVDVTTVAADVNTVEGRERLIEACPDPDI